MSIIKENKTNKKTSYSAQDVKFIKVNRFDEHDWANEARIGEWLICVSLRNQGDWIEDMDRTQIITDILTKNNHVYMLLDRNSNDEIYLNSMKAVEDLKKELESLTEKRNMWLCYIQEVMFDESIGEWSGSE